MKTCSTMGKRKSPAKKAPTPTRDEVAMGLSGSLPPSNRRDVEINATLKKTNDDLMTMGSRMSSVEGAVDRLSSAIGGLQASLDRRDDDERRPTRRPRRQQSPLGSPRWIQGRQSRSTSRGSSSSEGRRRRRSYSPKKPKGTDDTPFDQRNYLEKAIKLDNVEALFLVNTRTVRILLEQGEPTEAVISVLEHVEMLCEKALTRIYRPSALIGYDKAVRTRANVDGVEAFGRVRNVDVLRHFSFDATIVAGKGGNTKKSSGGSNKSSDTRSCFRFNSEEGCKLTQCKYPHVCMFCRATTHGSPACTGGSKPTK